MSARRRGRGSRSLRGSLGNSYIAGQTRVQGQPEHGFVVSLDPQGSLRYFTPLAGETAIRSLAWQRMSPEMPGSPDGVGLRVYSRTTTFSDRSAFLTRLSPSGTGFWCTQRLAAVELRGLTLDPLGLVYLTGIGGVSSADAWLSRVVDDDLPQITVTLTPSLIEAVNHKLVDITASINVDEYCDPSPKVSLLSIVSNEPDDGLGDGDTRMTFRMRHSAPMTGSSRCVPNAQAPELAASTPSPTE